MLKTVHTAATITLLIIHHTYTHTKKTPLCKDVQKVIYAYMDGTFDPEQTPSLVPYLCRAQKRTTNKSIASLYYLHNHYKNLIETTSKHKDYKKWFNSLSTAPKQIQYKIGKIWYNKHILWDNLFQKTYITDKTKQLLPNNTTISDIKLLQSFKALTPLLPCDFNVLTCPYDTFRFQRKKRHIISMVATKKHKNSLEKICYNKFISNQYKMTKPQINSWEDLCRDEITERINFCAVNFELPHALMNIAVPYVIMPFYLFLIFSIIGQDRIP